MQCERSVLWCLFCDAMCTCRWRMGVDIRLAVSHRVRRLLLLFIGVVASLTLILSKGCQSSYKVSLNNIGGFSCSGQAFGDEA